MSSYWGVFWINATSDQTAEHSYKQVARSGNVDENVRAATTWLAGQMYPWLLVIDNADDPNLQIERYFPGGDRGHVLITTRRPALKHFGNVGQGFQQFDKLDEIEARDLLLKHAQEETPWGDVARSIGRAIAEVLGYLPLALVYAGKAIAEGMTTLAECIVWFDESWNKIRLASKMSGRDVDENSKNVFAPYDAMLRNLEEEHSESAQDAIELLKLFSFMHNENISFDMLAKSARNPPALEAKMREEADRQQAQELIAKGVNTISKPKSWRHGLKNMIVSWAMWYEERLHFQVLLAVLRDDKRQAFDIHRLRLGLSRLTQKSLVTE